MIHTRREFITLVAAAGAAWPLAAGAQQAVPVVGYLSSGTPEQSAHLVSAFRKGLREVGFEEGHNVAIEFRWARNDNALLPELAADLVRRRVSAIATPAATPAALAAKAATNAIPVVFSTGADPVQVGLVASLNRPGGNVTGVGGMTAEVGAKRLGLLLELVPEAERLGIVINPSNPLSIALARQTQTGLVGQRQIHVFKATTNTEIDEVFSNLAENRIEALLIAPDTLFINRRVQLATLAVRHAVPVIYPFREDAEVGGLMSYGPSITDNARMAGGYTGRVLKGEKPAVLPVLQPTKFEFVLNLQTAKAIGVRVPPALVARADEVLE